MISARMRFLFFLFLFIPIVSSSQETELRFLSEQEISEELKGASPQVRVRFYDSLSNKWRLQDLAQSLVYSNKALENAETVPWTKELAHALFNRSKSYRQMSKYEKAFRDLDSARAIYQKLGMEAWVGTIYADYGNIYYKKGDYGKALENYLTGLRYGEKIKDPELMLICSNNVGNMYFLKGDTDLAIKYYLRSYEINKEGGNVEKSALILDNIALIYIQKKEYDMALMYQLSAVKVLEKFGKKGALGEIFISLGATYVEMKEYDNALNFFEKAYKINSELGSKFYTVVSLINLGNVYRLKGDFGSSVARLTEALELAKEGQMKDNMKEAALNLSSTYEAMSQSDKALEYYKLYSDLKDSIYNEQSTSEMNELSAKYEADKRVQEIEMLTQEKDLQDVKLQQSRTQTLSVFIGLALLLMLTGLIFYRYREKKKANDLLEEKNIAINEQKELVVEKNREITDSINYAKRIQESMLPSQKILNEYFKENFIFFQPKDIVSGDFYWALRKDDKLYVAAADCTGHGVPGALMSMIGVTFLRQIINEMNVTDTAEILNRLHALVLSTLNEDISRRDSKDGMDIALLKIDINEKKAEFSGAVRPMYSVGKGGLEVIKGDRYSIGGVKTIEETFTKVELDLKGGRTFYMFSDGFADQFGQKSGKKFMVKKLQELLKENCSRPMEEQYKIISNTFNDWKGEVDQTDDVLLIGIRV